MPDKKGETPVKAEMTIEVVSDALDRFVVALQQTTASLTAAPRHTLADYRTVIAARGLQDIQRRLDEGWEVLHLDLCDEVRTISGPAQRTSAMMWVPYAILGKRAVLMAADQQALLQDEDRQMRERASPIGPQEVVLDAEAPTTDPSSTPVEAVPEAPHEKVPARVITQPVARTGFEAEGGLKGR